MPPVFLPPPPLLSGQVVGAFHTPHTLCPSFPFCPHPPSIFTPLLPATMNCFHCFVPSPSGRLNAKRERTTPLPRRLSLLPYSLMRATRCLRLTLHRLWCHFAVYTVYHAPRAPRALHPTTSLHTPPPPTTPHPYPSTFCTLHTLHTHWWAITKACTLWQALTLCGLRILHWMES